MHDDCVLVRCIDFYLLFKFFKFWKQEFELYCATATQSSSDFSNHDSWDRLQLVFVNFESSIPWDWWNLHIKRGLLFTFALLMCCIACQYHLWTGFMWYAQNLQSYPLQLTPFLESFLFLFLFIPPCIFSLSLSGDHAICML